MFSRLLGLTRSFGAVATVASAAAVAACQPAPAVAQAAQVRTASTVPWELGYVTDVEGNLEHFRRYVAISRVVDFDSTGTRLDLRPGKVFVYGGDAFDKGPGDLRVAHMLTDLKERYPDRVVLILGNRDVNKSRLPGELGATEMAVPLEEHPGPYWVPKKHRVTPHDFVKQLVVQKWGKRQVSAWSDSTLQAEMAKLNTPENRLKYMLIHTMGSPQAFEHRRQELSDLEGHGTAAKISDSQVLQSYIDSAKPGGVVWQYLTHGQIGACIGNTLIVHGAINNVNVGFVPSPDLADALQDPIPGWHVDTSAQEWIALLNKWAARSVGEWRLQPDWDATRTTRGGSALRGYCYKNVMLGRSVAVETLFGKHDHPHPVPDKAVKFLNASGIQRLLVGHKPFGNTPTVLRSDDFETVSADTSYSDTSAADSRGIAVSEVCVQGTPTCNRTLVHGVYPDGRRFSFVLPRRCSASDCKHEVVAALDGRGDDAIGRPTPDGWIVTGKLDSLAGQGATRQPPAPCYLLRKGLPHYRVAHLEAETTTPTAAVSSKL